MRVVLGGVSWQMKADFITLCTMEKTLSATVFELAEKVGEGAVTLEELAAMLSHCTGMSIAEAGEALMGELGNVLQALAGYFMEVVGGRDESLPVTRAELVAMSEEFP